MRTALIGLLTNAKDYDACTIARADDHNLDYPYAIDVEDNSVFYESSEERDADFYAIVQMQSILPKHFRIVK